VCQFFDAHPRQPQLPCGILGIFLVLSARFNSETYASLMPPYGTVCFHRLSTEKSTYPQGLERTEKPCGAFWGRGRPRVAPCPVASILRVWHGSCIPPYLRYSPYRYCNAARFLLARFMLGDTWHACCYSRACAHVRACALARARLCALARAPEHGGLRSACEVC